jgi:hypothetical protein
MVPKHPPIDPDIKLFTTSRVLDYTCNNHNEVILLEDQLNLKPFVKLERCFLTSALGIIALILKIEAR